ncbi:mucin-5AC [Eptesicus fuscus]|uniref:mucin-5AC n=1 Tax=Eptesicus fuscus TaxID=29078 RepID=UPI0024040FF5|nr:mucin-5AC [Eptesicus fuscus]
MGVGRREPARLWALALALACAQHTGGAQLGSAPSTEHPHLPPAPQGPGGDALRGVTILPPLRTAPVVRARNPAHSGRVCSTWGDFHYKTFDGDVFRFPGRCNYVFSAHCGAAYEDFNVQLRRGPGAPAGALRGVTMKLRGLVLQLTPNSVLVNGRPTQLPFSQSGVLVEHSASFLKVVARLGLVFMWNEDGSLLLELDAKYANQTCGLCGDFNGVPVFDEFFSRGTRLSAVEFGNLQKMDGPTEQCQDPAPAPPGNCSIGAGLCEELLLGERFLGCHALVDAGSFVRACQQDLCLCAHADLARCACLTLAEYSRQCAHAGGLPPDWRGPGLCPQTCPHNMRYRECGSPCADTCSNQEHSQLCEDHCVAGCFCPEGMVLDDIGQTGCIPVSQCPCVHSGATYAPGATYSTDCTNCTCSGGRWSCQEVPCPGTCAVLGGAHFSTFDERPYTVHGDCSYVLAKPCNSSAFTVLAELRRCGLTDSETCLRSLTLSLEGGRTVVEVKASGEVLVNQLVTQLPVSAADVTVLRPSTFFVVAQTRLGLQAEVQLVPTMQVFLRAAPSLRGRTCGLCGNFNQNQADDFRALSGVVEGTAAAFANTWKTQASCPNVRGGFEDPCALSVENEKFAQHWCSGLTDPQGPFAPCHAAVSPGPYHSNCLFDTCNCEKSEDCLCAALSAYVHACAARGVLLRGWRAGVCTKPMDTCPPSMTYRYHVEACQPTCRALSSQDPACGVSFVPVDGCTCPDGTFLDDAGSCVPAASCPCYHGDAVVPNGEALHERGAVCTCTQGTLTCIGGNTPDPVCAPPMVYVDCRNATPGAAGAGCQKSCHTLDMDCYSPQCVPGCVCPAGLVADGEGGCVAADDCPCMHNEASYRAGQTVRVGCNTCTCKGRKWQCTEQPCLGTCAVYGDGHYLTFDGQRYSFNGACEYTLLQDHCGGNGSAQDAFRVVTENVPCGTTGTACSKAIKIFLGSYELKLSEGQVEVIEKGLGQEAPYSIRQVGIYLVVDTAAGLVLLWDKKTSIFLRLSPEFKGRVCGLCGNFDDNAVNDFTTRSQSVVGDALEFGNSWKFSPTCPDAPAPRDPCTANPYRKSWAQRRCSLLNSATFEACHAHVEPAQYYEACVSDACACDSGGDCECFCTAVAAYAQACRDAGVCVAWRTPDICPLFCDYYNPEGQCAWHYQPCGAPCLRTCRNPRGQCLHDTGGLEGCYPKCPPEAPIFDEDAMRCVATCPTPPPPPPCQVQGKSYRPGAVVPSDENCHSCICTENGVRCAYDAEACVCSYDGRRFRPGDVIYHTTDGTGGCISARCGPNGTIERTVQACGSSSPAPPTPFSFSATAVPPPRVCGTPRGPAPIGDRQLTAVSSTGPPGPATSPASTGTPRPRPSTASVTPGPACGEDCLWSAWLDVSRPGRGLDSGDFDTLDNLRAHGHPVCQAPRAVECRAERAPDVPLQVLGQQVECSPAVGLTCYNRDQVSGLCDNYQIRVLCCSPRACPTSRGTTSPAPGTTSTSAPGPSEVPTTWQPSSSSCWRESCSWTEWLDGSYPEAGINGGDFDTFQNLRSEGYAFCERPSQVECRAERFPDTPLAELGQTVVCNDSVGLVCLNKDQLPPICYNYQVRIQCCERLDVCRERTIPPESSRATRSTTHGARTQTQAPRTSTQHWTASSARVPPATATTPGTHAVTPRETTRCQPQCTWTKWFDVDFPSPGPHGGDVETYSNIVRSGERICSRPEYIAHLECRAQSRPEVSIARLGQVVQCSPDVGLVCRNRDQAGRFQMCLNYEVRVLCCEPRAGCPTFEPVTIPSTPSHHLRAGHQHHLRASHQHHLRASHQHHLRAGHQHHLRTTLPTPGTTSCQPQCTWTKWFDVDFPSPGPHGGDVETYSNIVHSGERICSRPEYIAHLECRAQSHPEVSIARLGQVVQCSPDVGLVCRNRDQAGRFQMCLNYEVRVLCCEPRAGCPTFEPVTTPSTPSVSITSPTETTSHVATSSTTSVPATSTTSVPATSTTSVPATSTTSVPATTTTSVPATTTTSVPATSTTSVPATSTTSVPATSTTSVPATTTTSVPATSTTSVPATSTTSVPATSTTSVPATTTTSVPATSTTSVPATSTTSVPATSTTSVPATSTTSVPATSTTSVPATSTTSVPATTTTSVPATSTTSVPATSTTSVPATSTTSVPATSTTSVPATSTTSVPATSTTSAPITTTTPVPAPQTTLPTPGTTSCQPQCTWTKWFDVDFPSPGPHGGDVETYSNIVRSGERICSRPEYIAHLECRAQSRPEVSIARLGQVVQCSPDVGLVCRNRDQAGRFQMCLNYEVRVLCCEPRAGCPLTSVTPYVTAAKSLPTTAPSSVVPTVTTLSTATPSVPPCYCSVSDKLYPAGSIIYQETDLAGHCYYAVCSLDCHVVRQADHACPTSTPPPTPATLPPGSSSSAPVTVTPPGCPSAVPPRTRGETWAMPNCSQATCEGNNIITLGPRPCPQVPAPTCANGYPALKVPDEDGCCQHYQCQCVCSGWGDPHYITFDGTYYTFLDNCTYVLVQQIVPVYGHFRVLIDNYFCDAEDGLSCPQSIIVEYRRERVVLTRKPVRGVMTNEIIFNNEVVSPGFRKGGLVVSQIGIKMYVAIPEIGVQVMFTGLIFSVEVPFSKFANNTEGQCGTCTNDPQDECRLPGGAVVTSCSDMSGYWKVTNPDQPSCHGPPQTRPTVGPTTPPAPCPPSPVCELILSDVFQPCHAVIPPRPYYLGCAFDHCHMTDADVVCSGLELYASLCASHGVCIDWRGRTNQTCPFTCPADKVYQPCGPSNPPFCYGGDSASLVALHDAGPVTEGCFCPEGMTLFSASKDVCVPTGCPRCLGPHGEPVEAGHTVSSECQECTCEAGTWTMSCRSQPCPPPPACPEPGLVPVPASPQAGQCCPQYTCACNTSYCPALPACPEGTRQILTREEGACCPSQQCRWTACSVNGTLYQPGAVVSSSLCETCRCEVPGGSDTFRISCETQTCHSHCPAGFEHRAQSGQCCRSCVQVACVMNTSDSSAHLFYPGETWSDPGNRCVTHECERHQDGLVVVTTKKACPPLSCPADQARLSEDGCCLSCPPPQPQNRSTCAVQHKHQVIRLQGCSSAGPVRLAYCQGNCGDTASMYSLEAQTLEHSCRCCQELRASPRNVTLRCADGSRRAFSYTQVEECGCVGQRCDARGDLHTEEPAPLQRRDPERGRWSRGARALPLAEGRLPPH